MYVTLTLLTLLSDSLLTFSLHHQSALTDIPDFFDTYGNPRDDNVVTILTRSALTLTTNSDYQPRLWTEAWTCDALNLTVKANPPWCESGGGITLEDFNALPGAFLAQLPSSYNTGLIKQFLPRFNSSVTREKITANDMPKDCATLPGAFYVRYATLPANYTVEDNDNWSIEVCMPQNQNTTPWKSTRLRQDFTEEMYLNISVIGYQLGYSSYSRSEGGIFKITSTTTGGYFELPNYMNGGKAGPLSDPIQNCGNNCYSQGNLGSDSKSDSNITSRSVNVIPRSTNITGSTMNESPASLLLDTVRNKGPLLATAISLFGDSSFIHARLRNPEAYIYNHMPAQRDGLCIEQVPFRALLQQDPLFGVGDCITNAAESWTDVELQIVDYLYSFYDDLNGEDERILQAFKSAVFLATEQWLLNPVAISPTFVVNYDLGAATQIPVISRTGIILVSVLLVLNIACLFAMAVYTTVTPCWTKQLDSFTMMRIGAVMAEQLPLRFAHKIDEIEFLDEKSGFVGDAGAVLGEPEICESETYVGELGLGAATPLNPRRRYSCYPADDVPTLEWQRRAIRISAPEILS